MLPSNHLFNTLSRLTKNQHEKLSITGPLTVRGIHRWAVDFQHKRPVMRKVFPCHDVVMLWAFKLPNQTDNDDFTEWKHFPRYWPFVRGIHRSPVNSPHKGQWREALLFSLICVWINGWVNNREAGDLKRHRAHYDVIVMKWPTPVSLLHFYCREELYARLRYRSISNYVLSLFSISNAFRRYEFCPDAPK